MLETHRGLRTVYFQTTKVPFLSPSDRPLQTVVPAARPVRSVVTAVLAEERWSEEASCCDRKISEVSYLYSPVAILYLVWELSCWFENSVVCTARSGTGEPVGMSD
jgi:hypothetical protein